MDADNPADEFLEQYIQGMGTELGGIYNSLKNEVFWVHAKWNQYRQIFAISPERIDLLNQTASYFFGVLQGTLFEDIVLHVARLTDRPQTAGKDNLTLQRLKRTGLIPDAQLADEVSKLLDCALAACGPARIWRNRHLAHRDLALALASPTDPLPGISRAEIEGALASIRSVLNGLTVYYGGPDINYKFVVTSGRDADSLVYYLGLGLRAEEQRQERLQKGEPLPEDFRLGSGV